MPTLFDLSLDACQCIWKRLGNNVTEDQALEFSDYTLHTLNSHAFIIYIILTTNYSCHLKDIFDRYMVILEKTLIMEANDELDTIFKIVLIKEEEMKHGIQIQQYLKTLNPSMPICSVKYSLKNEQICPQVKIRNSEIVGK